LLLIKIHRRRREKSKKFRIKNPNMKNLEKDKGGWREGSVRVVCSLSGDEIISAQGHKHKIGMAMAWHGI
jgi:hypothetical protein